MKIATINMTYQGLVPRVRKSFLAKDKESLQPHLRAFVDRAVTFTDCPDCGGARLNQAALVFRIGELNIADAAAAADQRPGRAGRGPPSTSRRSPHWCRPCSRRWTCSWRSVSAT